MKNTTPPWIIIIPSALVLYLVVTFGLQVWVPEDSALLSGSDGVSLGGRGYGRSPFGINPLIYLFLIVGTGVSMALAGGVMYFAKGGDDEPIDYDRL